MGPDPDDPHYIAAAIHARADTVLTWNLADFPADALASHEITVCPSDPYLCALLEHYAEQIPRTVTRLAAEKKDARR